MCDTYKNTDINEEMNLNYEEELTPKEIKCRKNAPSKKGIFSSFGTDDLLILLLLFIVLNDDCEDNSLALILAALLFMK